MELQLLLVDGDEVHRDTLSARLREDGFAVAGVEGIDSALVVVERCWPHLALVDLRFDDGTAEQLAHALGERGEVPIVVVTTANDATMRIRALERFAEDYLTRPYLYPELRARIRRVLQRTLLRSDLGEERIDLGQGRWVDLRRRTVAQGERTRRLTPTEARLLELFVLNPDRVLPTELILQRVWLDAPVGVNTLWEFVRRLRSKLGDDARDPRFIVSARGIGYQFRRPM